MLPYLDRESDASLPLEVLAVSSVLVNLSCLSLPESVERLGGVRVARETAASGNTSPTLPDSSAVSMSTAPICPSSADLISSPCVCPSWPWACSSGPCECPCPPRTKNPTIFEARPNEPTIRMSCGFVIVAMLTNLVMASRMIERQRAIRNTALKNAPRISARNHYWKVSYRGFASGNWKALTPKEYLSELDFCAALTAQSPTSRDIISFSYPTLA